MLLQAFYSIRSERQLMERLEFDRLFRWFVGIGVDDAVWDHSTFSKNRDRLLEGDLAARLLGAVLTQPQVKRLPQHGSLFGRRHADRTVGVDEELSAEGRLERAAGAWLRAEPRDGSPWPEAHQRDTRFQDRSGSEALSQGRGKEAPLCFMGHALMENCNGLVVEACLTEVNGHAERIMIEPRADEPRPITLGTDKAYDAEDLGSMNATPHVAQNANGRSSGD